MKSDQATFLVVEDNDLDVEKIERGFARLKINNTVIRAKDGLDALDHLRGSGGKEPPNPPYIVLLDINMPRMNGIEFLQEIRQDPKLSQTPVFVLTTSDHETDINAAHRHNICGYIVKPIKREQMAEVFSTLNHYWDLCEYPDGGDHP